MCLPSEDRRKAFLMKFCPTEPEAEREMQLQHQMALQQIEILAAERSNAI